MKRGEKQRPPGRRSMTRAQAIGAARLFEALGLCPSCAKRLADGLAQHPRSSAVVGFCEQSRTALLAMVTADGRFYVREYVVIEAVRHDLHPAPEMVQ